VEDHPVPNTLKANLHGAVVAFDAEHVDDPSARPLYVCGGFGANAGGDGLRYSTSGGGLFGVFLSDPEAEFARMEGWMVAAVLPETDLSPEQLAALADARAKHPARRDLTAPPG
jgi:hypothetical protein